MKLKTLLITLIMMFVITTTNVFGHSWYDENCCHDKDCYQVEAKPFGNGMLEFKTKSGVLIIDIIQNKDKIKPSQDEYYHICINQGRVLCIYVPGGV